MEEIKLKVELMQKDLNFLHEKTRKNESTILRQKEESDRNYAIKLIEKIVFGMISLMLVAMFGALMKLVIL